MMAAPAAVREKGAPKRQVMWELIRRLRYFTATDLASYAMATRTAANVFTTELVEAKFVQVLRDLDGFPRILHLVDDPGAALPNELHDQTWQSIRILKNFTERSLLATVPAARNMLVFRTYLSALRKTGVLKAHIPKKGAGYHYRLLKDLGAKSPVLLSKGHGSGLFDRNSGVILNIKTEGKHANANLT